DILRKIFAGSGEVPGAPACPGTLDAPGLPELLKLRTGYAYKSIVTVLVDNSQVNHAVGALVWEGVCQQAVNDTENSSGGANSKRQRKNRSEGQAGLPSQIAVAEL